jgi:hypothetical protein
VIRIINGALDTVIIDGEESLALRGVVDPLDLSTIKADKYQRETLAPTKIEVLKRALRTSRVPDIDLGMRGSSASEQVIDGQIVWILDDDVYVIDGLQRKTAGEQLVDEGIMPHIGALIHFDTNEAWERMRFEALNVGQTGLNSNIILRNLAEENAGAALMLDLTTSQPKFVLHDRVTWTQNMKRGEMITAITYYKTVGRLHSHLGPGRNEVKSLARSSMLKVIDRAGKGNFTSNVMSFFWLIEECFGISSVAYRKSATQLKTTFLLALAGVLSDHEDFWDNNRLVIPADLRRKLAKFPINDPSVKAYASSAGMAIKTLEMLLVDHINSGKRTRHLKRRATADLFDAIEESTDTKASDIA